MRVTLPESQRMRKQGTGVTSFSIVLHVAALGVAVVTTARSEVKLPTLPPEEVRLIQPEDPAPVVKPTDKNPWTGPTTVGLFPPIEILDVFPVDFKPPEFDPQGWALVTKQGEPAPTSAEPVTAVDEPLTEVEVEKPVVLRAGNPNPRYPHLLQQAGMEGSVVVRFVVDTLGAVEAPSIAVIQATHELFARSVRDALLKMKFVPAEAGGHRARQLVEQRFGFRMKDS